MVVSGPRVKMGPFWGHLYAAQSGSDWLVGPVRKVGQVFVVYEMTGPEVTVPEHSGCCRQSSFSMATPRKMALPANNIHRKTGWLRA